MDNKEALNIINMLGDPRYYTEKLSDYIRDQQSTIDGLLWAIGNGKRMLGSIVYINIGNKEIPNIIKTFIAKIEYSEDSTFYKCPIEKKDVSILGAYYNDELMKDKKEVFEKYPGAIIEILVEAVKVKIGGDLLSIYRKNSSKIC